MDLFIDKTVLSVKEVESFQDTPSLVQGLKNAGANLNGRALQNGEELVEETYSSSIYEETVSSAKMTKPAIEEFEKYDIDAFIKFLQQQGVGLSQDDQDTLRREGINGNNFRLLSRDDLWKKFKFTMGEANPSELEVLRQRNTELEEKMVELNMWRRLALLNDKKITELKD
ncbi:uncharacterized protein OCT59_014451 [Rhizophagus irregularis]|uniref:uncharacterized protein n=1 Tax=Rhizophagus irregularis TaxID=588596 RepID=UPI003327F324|nr:hypothetical protein OCT59_014451 [Rhizophagus irregularis]